MRFGLWYDFRNPRRWHRPYHALYEENLEQIVWAESLGFESIWLSEHHVTDDGYLPSIFPMLATIAAKTETLQIGTAILLAPFQHPVRFAEDAAVVDQLSGGRLELGLGLGYRASEFEVLGVPRTERGSRTEELVEVARLAWSGEPFSHAGRHWRFDSIQVTPPPNQHGGPPLWLGGSTPAAARRAGRLGCHFMPDANVSPEVVELYRRTREEHAPGPPGLIAINPAIYVSDDPERAWDEVKEHFLYAYNGYRRWYAESGEPTAPPLEDPDALPRERYLVGTPSEVASSISRIYERLRFDRLFFWARPPGMAPDRSSRSLELFAREVVPNLSELKP